MDIHRYVLGSDPIALQISVEHGKPRLTAVFLRDENGTPLDPPDVMHMATFVSESHAHSVVQWLDAMTEMVTNAINLHAKMAAKHAKAAGVDPLAPDPAPDITNITHLLQLSEQRHGAEN